LVLGNKVDLEDEQRRVSTLEVKKFCQQNGNMIFYEVSAKNNLNVEKAFKELAVKVIAR
jgi:Ras-related protein Rab-7A